MLAYRSLEWLPNRTLRVLDQRMIPHALEYLDTQDYRQVAEMVRQMVVRGAPAIGAAAAQCLARAAMVGVLAAESVAGVPTYRGMVPGAFA